MSCKCISDWSNRSTGVVARSLWLATLGLLFVSRHASGQACASSGAFAAVDGLAGPLCAQATAPKGRQVVILTLLENYTYWKAGVGCNSRVVGDCAPSSMQLTIAAIGYTYSLSGSASQPPAGTGWTTQESPPECTDPGCAPCLEKETKAITACNMDQTCVQAAQADYQVCTSGLAHDILVLANRQSAKVIPLPPGLTSNGPVVLEVRVTSSGQANLGNLRITAGLYSDVHFTLTQTPAAMRPRDARDSAAHCTTPDVRGQVHDGDCHPQYTVGFACNTSSTHALLRQNDESDPVLLAAASGAPASSAYARLRRRRLLGSMFPYVSAPPPMCPNPRVSYQFLLTPQTQWLQGTSTNFGSDAADQPDYVFERGAVAGYPMSLNMNLAAPQDGGLSISTPGFVTTAQTVTVTSRDFGGAAQLRAVATFEGGPTVNADVVDSAGLAVGAPSGACGVAFGRATFASLPVDQDCNGMSDAWEATFGGALSPDADLDQAANNGSTVGDGFTVLEEYRGFHHIDRSGGGEVIRWTPTDPIRKLDLFFWDFDHLFQGDLTYFRSQFPFIDLWEVDERMGLRILDHPLHSAVVSRININSTSSNSVYPLLLVNADLKAVCAGPRARGGILGHAPDDPPASGPDGRAIRLDDSNLSLCASLFHFPVNDWRQILIAHEIGHNLGRRHPTESRGFRAVDYLADFSRLSALPINQYSYEAPQTRDFYAWLQNYNDSSAGGPTILRIADRAQAGLGVLGGVSISLMDGPYFSHFSPPQRGLYRHLTSTPLSSMTVLVVQVSLLNGALANVMNWTPRLDAPFHSIAAYSFSSSDVTSACVKSCR